MPGHYGKKMDDKKKKAGKKMPKNKVAKKKM